MLSRSVILNALGEAAILVLGFGVSVVLARWLGPHDRGVLAIMISVTELAYIAAACGLPVAVAYRVARDPETSGALLGNTLLYGAALGAVSVPVFWLLRHPIASAFAQGRGGYGWIVVGFLVPVSLIGRTVLGQISGMLRFGLTNALAIGSRLVYAVVALVLLTATGLGLTAALVGIGASAVALGIASLAILLPRTGLRLDRCVFRGMLGYGSRNQLSLLFQEINYRLDVLILQFFQPLTQVGYYVVAQIVAELTISWSRSFQGVLPIVSSERVEERRISTMINSIRHHGILAAVTLLGTAIAGPLLIVVGFGSQFRAAIGPMLALLPGIWFLGTGRVAGSNLAGFGRPGLPALLAGVAAFVTVTLDLSLIPVLGVYGAVIASVAAYTTYGVASMLALSRVSRVPLRELLVPTRDDLRLYPAAAARLLEGLRGA